jgi:peptide deformylase
MQILTTPNPMLFTAAQKVTDIPAAKKLGVEMLKEMEAAPGVGLAAPQVGHSLRLFVASVTGKAQDGIIFINPIFVPLSTERETQEEGCLSVPGVKLPISRLKSIAVKYTDVSDSIVTMQASGLLARIIQHEYDHLCGILFSDRYAEATNGTI